MNLTKINRHVPHRHTAPPPHHSITHTSKEHLFKECITRKDETRTLWKEVDRVGKARERSKKDKDTARVGKGRKGFG